MRQHGRVALDPLCPRCLSNQPEWMRPRLGRAAVVVHCRCGRSLLWVRHAAGFYSRAVSKEAYDRAQEEVRRGF